MADLPARPGCAFRKLDCGFARSRTSVANWRTALSGLVLKGLVVSGGIGVAVFGAGQTAGPSFAHAVAFEGDAVDVVDDPVQAGVGDVLIAVVDGLKGFSEAITTVFPPV